MFIAIPAPEDFSFVVDFDDGIVTQGVFANIWIFYGAVAKNQFVALWIGFHTRHIVAYGISLDLVVMVLTCHPTGFIARIFDVFVAIKAPNYIAIPVYFHKIQLILPSVFCISLSKAAVNMASFDEFIRKALKVFPIVDQATIHIKEHGAKFISRNKGVAIKTFVGIINRCAGRENTWMSHKKTSLFIGGNKLCPYYTY